MIAKVCTQYNKAHILVEVNDIGGQISDGLHFEIEYDNILMTTQKGRAGQILGAMFSQRGSQLGVRMTKQIKKMGTANIKAIIEADKLVINDFNIIEEMSTLSEKINLGKQKKVVMTTIWLSRNIWLVSQSKIL